MHFPVFVPSKGRTTVIVDSHSEFSGPKSSDSDSDKLRDAVQQFVKAKHPNLDGFEAFDQAHRYQIDFPKGW